MELVYVEWEDASAVDDHVGWIDRASPVEPKRQVFHQAGFVFDMDLEAIILTEAYNDDHIAPRTRIPLGMIRRLVHLDPKRDGVEAQL